MAKNTSPRQPDSTQDSEKFDLNYVHELRSRLEGIFQKAEGDVERFQADAVSDQITDMIKRLSGDQSLSRSARFSAIIDIENMIALERQSLEPQIPDKAPELWVDRDKSIDENPFQFAKRVYADCFEVLTQGVLQSLDSGLATAMYRYEKEHGAPNDGTYVPKKHPAAETEEPVTWEQILHSASLHTRNLLRAYQARKKHGKPRNSV